MTTATATTPAVATAPPADTAAPWGLVTGAVVLAVAVVPAVLLLPHDRVSADTTLPFAGWLAVGVAGAVVVDRPRWRRVGVVALLVAFVPAVVVLGARVSGGPSVDLGAALWTRVPVWPAALVLLAAAGWRADDRDGRRWRVWFVVSTAAAAAVWAVAVTVAVTAAPLPVPDPEAAARAAAVVALFAVAATVVTAGYGQGPRPLDEPLLDLALATGAVLLAGVSGAGLRAFAQSQVIAGADIQGVVAGAVVLGLALPGALRVRRDVLSRRYGPGVLPEVDVAALTAGLGVAEDPRSLLPQAARMVVHAGGVAQARIVLEADRAPEAGEVQDPAADGDDGPGWVSFPLVATGHGVGTLRVRSRGTDGLEARNLAGIARLLPTLALVVRAVALALAAQDSRSDLVRQRERERARILQDLHDDLGPALAGMSMRVRAARAQEPSELLEALESGLATCRADLRRVVAGLTPPALSSAGTAAALQALVDSFRAGAGPDVALVGEVPDDLDAEVAVVLYRCVAEGITNAVRHSGARHVQVRVDRADGAIRAQVEDDGTSGGPVVPGVGLTSLRSRAGDVGGTLRVEATAAGGTRLVLDLPDPSPTAAQAGS